MRIEKNRDEPEYQGIHALQPSRGDVLESEIKHLYLVGTSGWMVQLDDGRYFSWNDTHLAGMKFINVTHLVKVVYER